MRQVSNGRSDGSRKRSSNPLVGFALGLLRQYLVALAVFALVMGVAFVAFG